MSENMLTLPGSFVLGCNYWASHAGTAMWSDWRPDVVEEDMRRLSETGVKLIRVFPLWSDFQPVKQLNTFMGKCREYRHGEELLPCTEIGLAGLSEEALLKFEQLLSFACKYNIKVMVGLVTGWMSGRLFVPQLVEGKNLLTDPIAIKWEVRFVKTFVKYFQNNSTIIAWNLGNECNCMAEVPDRDAAWLWVSIISSSIRSVDAKRPVISGMHSLTIDGKWTIEDQAESVDILTTHPYPLFTPHCSQDPLDEMRTVLHATSETCFYRGIGNKSCFVEEMGSLNPMMGEEQLVGRFMRTNLFSLYAHDCRGMLWWCNNEQEQLEHAPYDWSACERELGLFRADNTRKPVGDEILQFHRMLSALPFKQLPQRMVEGVCILSQDQDHWGVAYSSFILAKQAGVDIEFQSSEQKLREASVYMLPCISGLAVISRHQWLELLQRVQDGAVLYISHSDGFLTNFEKVTGLRVKVRRHATKPAEALFKCSDGEYSLQIDGPIQLVLEAAGADTLGHDAEGNPVFSCFHYGKGQVYFLSLPLELHLTNSPGIFGSDEYGEYWRIYNQVFSTVRSNRAIMKYSSQLGVTEHPMEDGKRVVIFINYSTTPIKEKITLSHEWKLDSVLHGGYPLEVDSKLEICLRENDGAILVITRK